ncbi:hypothetical protein OG401_37790 [Kitasatospora purpeofusca]|uniref:hypothetical protein n=1 Tax=Kitasatospora purpeofusca TaxID=67352 RepID=UPI002253F1EB|nr:hypothetical protein [Kitasatospora purpeofusca]MCX4689982.1 hypothetical protein [Kitasatospora purpeofusca]
MSATRLPAALAPWAESLSALSPELALALGPLLRRLDQLVGTREPVTDAPGEPDGTGGIGRSGRPEQLLPAEWLLAEEHPDEFMRRFVDRELLYLAPEFRSSVTRGRTVVLVDAGPSQAGAGRLVQLAALLVLHRRAAARGSELLVGVLGDPPGRWLSGEPADLLPSWLAARRPAEPTAEQVREAAAGLDAADRVWLLTSPRLADGLPGLPAGPAAAAAAGAAGASGTPRVLATEVARWGPAGATHVTVRLDRTEVELPLPAADIAVRALRGAEFRRKGPVLVPAPAGAVGTPGRALPVFTTDATVLLTRGRREGTLLATDVRRSEHKHAAVTRTKAHHLNGQVIAAGRTGRRLFALHLHRGRVLRYVSGRQVGGAAEFVVDPAFLGLDGTVAEVLAGRPLLPLLCSGDDLLVPVAGRWRRIAPDGAVTDDGPVDDRAEGPHGFERFREPRLFDRTPQREALRAPHLVHAGGTAAWSHDGRTWTVWTRLGDERRLSFRKKVLVAGLVHDGREPVLITWSPDSRMVRAIRHNSTRTLSRFSGGTAPPAVHPTEPLIAAEVRPGRVVVGDATTGRIHHVIGSNE